jgi:hypothetical protein
MLISSLNDEIARLRKDFKTQLVHAAYGIAHRQSALGGGLGTGLGVGGKKAQAKLTPRSKARAKAQGRNTMLDVRNLETGY